jgi:polyisoprenyl-phosphate glycosyltransferase
MMAELRAERRASLAIVIPNFNDWESLRQLLPKLDRAVEGVGRRVSVLVVDDASTEPIPEGWLRQDFIALDSVEILHLRSNQGHQRAIALGLYHIHEFTDAEAVVVMDGDGEDRPEDLPELLGAFSSSGAAAEGCAVVFAARTKRMESVGFRLCYRAYRLVHHALTGVAVRVGNFSVISRRALGRLMAVPDLWNHYAASVYRARLPRRLVPLPRGRRLAGASKMNFVSLLIHGLSAMSVFSDQVSARLLTMAVGFAVVAMGGIGVTAGVRWFTDLAIPGWATFTVGLLLLLVVQLLSFATLFAFLIASRRSSVNFLLTRDAPYFILGRTTAYTAAGARIASPAAKSTTPSDA